DDKLSKIRVRPSRRSFRSIRASRNCRGLLALYESIKIPARSGWWRIGGGFCQNELILEFPTKSMPSDFCAQDPWQLGSRIEPPGPGGAWHRAGRRPDPVGRPDNKLREIPVRQSGMSLRSIQVLPRLLFLLQVNFLKEEVLDLGAKLAVRTGLRHDVLP